MKLGDRVQIVSYLGDAHGSKIGKVGTVIAITLKSEQFYSSEVVVAIPSRMGNKKQEKVHLNWSDIKKVKVLKAYAYRNGFDVIWKSKADAHGYERIPEFDFEREIVE